MQWHQHKRCYCIMRSTVRIDDDLMTELKARASSSGLSLTRMLNRTLRAGLRVPREQGVNAEQFEQRTFGMGAPRLSVNKALALAAMLEDEELARKLALRK